MDASPYHRVPMRSEGRARTQADANFAETIVSYSLSDRECWLTANPLPFAPHAAEFSLDRTSTSASGRARAADSPSAGHHRSAFTGHQEAVEAAIRFTSKGIWWKMEAVATGFTGALVWGPPARASSCRENPNARHARRPLSWHAVGDGSQSSVARRRVDAVSGCNVFWDRQATVVQQRERDRWQ
jgi:hypothetical protein